MNTEPNFGELREIVRSFVTRSLSSISTTSHALDAVAINNALMYAQRKHDFQWNKKVVYCDLNPKADISSDFYLESTDGAVTVKRIEQAYRTNTSGQQYPVEYISRATFADKIQRRVQLGQIDTTDTSTAIGLNWIVHHGADLYAYPQSTSLPERVYFDAIIYQPRLSTDTDTNFLLQHGYDFILYRSIIELNFLIKEDDRFEINKNLVDEAWEALEDWDSRLNSPTDTELDL